MGDIAEGDFENRAETGPHSQADNQERRSRQPGRHRDARPQDGEPEAKRAEQGGRQADDDQPATENGEQRTTGYRSANDAHHDRDQTQCCVRRVEMQHELEVQRDDVAQTAHRGKECQPQDESGSESLVLQE